MLFRFYVPRYQETGAAGAYAAKLESKGGLRELELQRHPRLIRLHIVAGKDLCFRSSNNLAHRHGRSALAAGWICQLTRYRPARSGMYGP